MSHRYRQVACSGQFLTQLLTVSGEDIHVRLVQNGLPMGTRFVSSHPTPGDIIAIVVEHESFDDVDVNHGGSIPQHPEPVFEKVQRDPFEERADESYQ